MTFFEKKAYIQKCSAMSDFYQLFKINIGLAKLFSVYLDHIGNLSGPLHYFYTH